MPIISSKKCQIKSVYTGIGKKSGKAYTILTIQEPNGNEFGINCNGLQGLEQLPIQEKCEFEAEVRANRYGMSFIPENPPVFKFAQAK